MRDGGIEGLPGAGVGSELLPLDPLVQAKSDDPMRRSEYSVSPAVAICAGAGVGAIATDQVTDLYEMELQGTAEFQVRRSEAVIDGSASWNAVGVATPVRDEVVVKLLRESVWRLLAQR